MGQEGNLPGSGPAAGAHRSQKKGNACRAALTALVGMAYVSPAYAYLDPGTGSIILQGLLASVAAAIAFVGMYWQRFKSYLSSVFSSKKSTDPKTEEDTEN